MKIINLLPHNVDVCDEYGNIIKTYNASGIVARVTNDYSSAGCIDGVPFVVRGDETIVGLPEPQKDTFYIVSNIMLSYCCDRLDLLAPVKLVKINGRTVGCQAFVGNR